VAPGWGQMAAVNLIGSYNYSLVALSVFIAVFASYAALDLASRVTAAGGWTRALWVLGGACAMGTGIWSMHYIGMLAFILPIPVAYHWPTVLLSLFAAILASAIALYVVSRQKMGASQAVAGSVLMGAGIAGMHYIGMAAMRLPAVCQFNSSLVVLSVAFAVLISLAALWITFHLRDEKTGIGRKKLAGAVVMGAAIPVMHYTGMAAASFTSSGMPADLSHAVSISALGIAGIVAVTFIVLGLALLTSWVDRRFAAQIFELQQQRSEAYLAEAQRLSHTGSFGWKPSTGEIIWSEETFRVFQHDRTTTPTVELILQRVHPEDVALVKQTIERATQDGKNFEHEYRLLMPDGSLKHVHVVAHAQRDESGELEFVGAVMDTTAVKDVEKKLRRSEESLLEAQKLSNTGSWRHDVVSGEVTVSPEIDRIHDIKPDEDPSNTEFFFNKFHPEDRKRVVDLFERAEREKTAFQVDYRIVLPDGNIKYLRTIGHPILNESGDLVEFVGTAMDITAATQAEKTLRESEAYLAEAQRLSHTGSWARVSATGEMRYWSEECYRVLGFDPRDGLPRFETFLQRVHPDDQAKIREISAAAGRAKFDYETDYRIVHPGGEIRDIQVVAHPVFNPSGDLVEYVGTVMDVTERRRSEEKLRQSEAYLAEAQKLTHTGSWVWEVAERRALHLSEEWYRVYGFDPKEGMSAWNKRLERIHPDDCDGRQQAIDRAINEKSDYEVEYRILLPGGAVRYIRSVGHPVLNASGDLVQFVGSSTDITERKQAEEALHQAQKDVARINRITTMGELTASLAHEVKQPIAAAVTDANTCVRWLSRDDPDVEEAREAASRVVKDATRAAEIITRVRQLFKKGTPEQALIDVNEIIREMIVLLGSDATRYDVSIQTELAKDLPQVMGDRVQMQQVLMNLMTNSIDAMKDLDGTRELIISSQAEHGQLMISVSDTGVGLPPKQADQIFDAFFTTKPQGTGMGLRISRSIVESHGGRLWAADNSPRGASFHLTLPIKAEAGE
jgi:PAS domain S-box-containing protein